MSDAQTVRFAEECLYLAANRYACALQDFARQPTEENQHHVSTTRAELRVAATAYARAADAFRSQAEIKLYEQGMRELEAAGSLFAKIRGSDV